MRWAAGPTWTSHRPNLKMPSPILKKPESPKKILKKPEKQNSLFLFPSDENPKFVGFSKALRFEYSISVVIQFRP